MLPPPDDPFYAPSSWCSLLLVLPPLGALSYDYSFLLLPAPDALSSWCSLLALLIIPFPWCSPLLMVLPHLSTS